jgi:hypothetical protein
MTAIATILEDVEVAGIGVEGRRIIFVDKVVVEAKNKEEEEEEMNNL